MNFMRQHAFTQHSSIIFCLPFMSRLLLNVVLIVTITVDQKLHEAMYIFLCNLCINGLYGTAGFYPKFLNDLLSPFHVVYYAECVLQSFVIHSSSGNDYQF